MSTYNMRIYIREKCELCEEAVEVAEKLAKFYPLKWEVYNITNDPEAYERFGMEIPVVELDGVQIAVGKVTMVDMVGYMERKYRETAGK